MTNAARLQIVVAADTGDAEKKLQQLGQQVQTFGQSFTQGLGIGAGMAALQAGLGLVTGTFGQLKGAVIDFNQQIDQSRAVFTRYFNGNQQMAESFLTTLKGFAASTPFEFKDLSQLAIRLQNANTSANDIIPTIKAIGNAASASGSLSQASLDRITLALTQMQMKGKVTGEEMLQLVEAGVPAWDLLAKATGKPIPVLQDLASKGQISSDVLIKAFRDAYENAGLMEGASKSLEGALSTIRDVGTQAFADIGRSIYDLATDGANALATFLSSEQFQAWAEAARIGVESVVGGVRSLLETLAPVGQVLQQAFGQFTAGDFAGGFGTIASAVQNALGGALQSVQEFAQHMFGAGTNLVTELAGGIVDGAQGVLQGAIDTVASMIASFLIGNSPPPEGPLAQIRQGGANVIAAWGEGAASAADSAVKPAAAKIAGGLDELKTAGRGAEESIREIGRAISEIDSAANGLKRQVEDVKDAYRDQLDPLEDQLKALTGIKDLEAERHKLELSLEEAQLRQAEIAAQGDPVRRRELQDRLSALKTRQDEVKTAREIADAEKAIAGTEKDRLRDKLEASKLDREEADLRDKLKSAKGDEKDRIKDRLEELKIRRQIAEADDKERAEKAERARQDAKARLDELNARKELDGLTDKTALAGIKKRQDELKAERDQMALVEQRSKLERDLAALPIREEIERIKAEQEATLKPLQDQLETYGRQKQDLSEQRQHWQGIKSEITAAATALKDQEAATKKAEKAAQEAAKNKPTTGVDKNFTPDAAAEAAIAKAKEAGGRLAENLKSGFINWLTEKPLLSVGSIAGALFGAGQGAAIGASLGSVVPVIGTAIGGLLGAGIGAAIGGIGANVILAPLQKKLEEILGPFGPMISLFFQMNLRQAFEEDGVVGAIEYLLDHLGAALTKGIPLLAGKLSEWTSAFVDWGVEVAPRVLTAVDRVIDDLLSWIDRNVGPIGNQLYAWSLALVDWARTGGLELLSRLATLGGQVLNWIGANATLIAGKLLEWATAFVAWVGPKIPELLTALRDLGIAMVEWMGTHLGDLLDGIGKWAIEFVNWVGPKIPPLLAELGKLLASLVEWIATDALPTMVTKLAEWGLAFVDWVGPRILPLLAELGKLWWAIEKWMLFTALPAIVLKLAEWGGAFLGWVVKDVLPTLPEKLGAILTSVGNWITEKVGDITTAAAALGAGMLEGIQRGLSNNWGALKEWITENIGKQLPEWMQKLLGIHSPSTVFAEIGKNLILGLIVGMEGKSGDLLAAAKKLFDFGNVHGPGLDLIREIGELARGIGGMDFARAAMAISASETGGGKHLSEIGGTGAQGPFQFDPGGELKNFAKFLKVNLDEAGLIARTQPMLAAKWALDGYLGDSLRKGLEKGLRGRELALYGSRYGQRPFGDNWKKAGEWYEQLFPGLAQGGIARATPGGILARIAEGGRDEAVIPLPHGWQSGAAGGSTGTFTPTQTIRLQVMIGNDLAEEIYVTGRDIAIKRGSEMAAGS